MFKRCKSFGYALTCRVPTARACFDTTGWLKPPVP